MLLTIQFPIADSRPFVDLETGRLKRPGWPWPVVDQDFIRGFGMIRGRWDGGLSGWVGEASACDAVRALRFEGLPPLALPELLKPLTTEVKFRNFYADGKVLSKYEAGLVIRPDPTMERPDQPLTRRFFEHFLRLKVAVPMPDGNRAHCELWQAGKHLAALYLASSTPAALAGKLPAWLAIAGAPIALLDYSGESCALDTFLSKRVKLIQHPEASLAQIAIPMQGINLRVWLLSSSTLTKDVARRLRIALLRLHAEKECLQRVLTNLSCGNIQPEPFGPAAAQLQDYFNYATRRVLKLQRRSAAALEQEPEQAEDAEVELARRVEDAILPGERDSILRALEQMQARPNIQSKVKDFVGASIGASAEADNLAHTGIDAAGKERIVQALATQAANGMLDAEEYFHHLVSSLNLPQQLKNQIIGGWKGHTEYDARRLVEWALGSPTGAGEQPVILTLLSQIRGSLGGAERAFVDGILIANHLLDKSVPREEKTPMSNPSRTIAPQDIERIVQVLAVQALDSQDDPKFFFRSLVRSATLPQAFQFELGSPWSSDPKADARNLVIWAIGKGGNPADPRYTTLGSLLEPLLPKLGVEAAQLLVAEIVAYSLIYDRKLQDALMARYRVPAPAKIRRPLPDGAAPFYEPEPELSPEPEFELLGEREGVQLQAFLRPEPEYFDVGFLMSAMSRSASICAIELPPELGRGGGTGFLIGADLVLTNHHVLQFTPAENLQANAASAVLRFGKISATAGEAAQGHVFKLDASQPVVKFSPKEALDYALLRVEEGITAVQEIKPAPFTTQRPARGMGLNILQHPGDEEMKLTISGNGVVDVFPELGLVQYVTRATGGSSGAPCFNDQWQVVAIHHAEMSRVFGKVREGILFEAIHNEIAQYL
jgi:V8-like Glu-specific endopeptidase